MQQQVSKQRNGGASAEGASGSGCPYATGDSEELRQQWQRADYHAKVPGKQWADKVRQPHQLEPHLDKHDVQWHPARLAMGDCVPAGHFPSPWVPAGHFPSCEQSSNASQLGVATHTASLCGARRIPVS